MKRKDSIPWKLSFNLTKRTIQKQPRFVRTIESLTHDEWVFWSGFVAGVIAMSHESMHALLHGPECAQLAVMEHAFQHFMRTGSVRADGTPFDATAMPWDEMRGVLESVVEVIQKKEDGGSDEHSEQC